MNKTKTVFSFLLQAVRLKCAGPHSGTELQIRTGDQNTHRGGDAESDEYSEQTEGGDFDVITKHDSGLQHFLTA